MFVVSLLCVWPAWSVTALVHLHWLPERAGFSNHDYRRRRVALCIVDALARFPSCVRMSVSRCTCTSLLSCAVPSEVRHRPGRYAAPDSPSTSFMISFSRANAADVRLYVSLSPSAMSSGTRCSRDHVFSRKSSLRKQQHGSLSMPGKLCIVRGYPSSPPLLQVALPDSVESPGADGKDPAKHHSSSWTAYRQVALVADLLESSWRWQILPVWMRRHCRLLAVEEAKLDDTDRRSILLCIHCCPLCIILMCDF